MGHLQFGSENNLGSEKNVLCVRIQTLQRHFEGREHASDEDEGEVCGKTVVEPWLPLRLTMQGGLGRHT